MNYRSQVSSGNIEIIIQQAKKYKDIIDNNEILNGYDQTKDYKWHKDGLVYLNRLLNRSKIAQIKDISDLVKHPRNSRWAGSNTIMFGGAPGISKRRIDEFLKNDLSDFKRKIDYLLYGKDPLEIRFDEITHGKEKIRGIGPFMASEFLASSKNGNKYTIWHKYCGKALKSLGFNLSFNPSTDRLSGKRYLEFNEACIYLRDILNDGLNEPNIDLVWVHQFLWHYVYHHT